MFSILYSFPKQYIVYNAGQKKKKKKIWKHTNFFVTQTKLIDFIN